MIPADLYKIIILVITAYAVSCVGDDNKCYGLLDIAMAFLIAMIFVVGV